MKSLLEQRQHQHLFSGCDPDYVNLRSRDLAAHAPKEMLNVIALKILRGLVVDTTRFLPGVKGLQRDLVTLEARLENEGVAVLSVALANLGKALDKGISEESFACPVGFKKAKGGKIPLLFSGIFCIVFDSSTGLLAKDRDLTLEISLLRQLLYFLEEACYDGVFGREIEEQSHSELYARELEHTGNRCLMPRPTCACFTITPIRFRYLSGVKV